MLNALRQQVYIGNHDIDLLLFADDIALVALSARDLQLKICAIKKFFEENNLKVNLGKTKVVIFRRRKPLAPHHFMWGNAKIEIVDSYIYLGIIFHYSGKFDMACNHFITKAKQAQGLLIKLFYRAKIHNFKTQEHLFDSLAKSVLLYGVVLWGAGNMDKLCVFQNKFLRQLFYLPNETSRYKLLMETHMKPIEYSILSLILKFLHRIYKKPKDSLVKACFYRLVSISNSEVKYNWYSQVSSFLFKCGVKGLRNDLQVLNSKIKIRNIINNYCTDFINENVMYMQKSSGIYKSIKPKIGTEPYLNLKLSFSVKKFMFQLRCGGNNIYMKDCDDLLGNRKNSFQNCDICDGGIEDAYHVFCVCPHYTHFRRLLETQINAKINQISINEYCSTILKCTKNIDKMNNFYLFWRKCMKTRQFIRTY